MPLLTADWPDSAPVPQEEYFLSIATDNENNHWALHGIDNDYAPILFWRTPILIMEDLHAVNDDLVGELARQLPNAFRNFIFGEDENADATTATTNNNNENENFNDERICTAQRAKETAEAKRGGCKLTVYIVSSNQNQNNLLGKLLDSIPTSVYLLKGGDFFPESEYTLDEYSINTLERLANLRGAGYRFGYPALVFDGSHSTLTYTAADSNGCILGGGIGLGLALRLKCLREQNPNIDLPDISLDSVKNVIEEVRMKKTPMSVFGNNTTDAMIVSMLSEVSNNIRHVSKLWLDRVGYGHWSGTSNAVKGHGKKEAKDGKGQRGNLERKITTTGESGDTLKGLLESRRGGIFEVPVTNNENYNAQNVKQLLHFGVTSIVKSAVLDPDNGSVGSLTFSTSVSLESSLVQGKNQDITKAMAYVGRRVAKKDINPDSKQQRLLQGTIAKRAEEKPWIGGLSVRYDDGMMEEVELKDVDSMIGLYDDFLKESLKSISALSAEEPAPKRKKRGKLPSKKKPLGSSFVGVRIAKKFDSGIFFGSITEYIAANMSKDGEFWHVTYDDGDEEDFDKHSLSKAISFHIKHRKDDHEYAPEDDKGNKEVTNV